MSIFAFVIIILRYEKRGIKIDLHHVGDMQHGSTGTGNANGLSAGRMVEGWRHSDAHTWAGAV